jgi:tetratricopeptide (TPR) repeat protein
MNMKLGGFWIIGVLTLFSCQPNKLVVIQEEVEQYLSENENSIDDLISELEFWKNKMNDDPRGYIFFQKAAQTSIKCFDKTANINYLKQARKFYTSADIILQGHLKSVNKLQISQLEMMLHNFKEAADFAAQGLELSNESFGPLMTQFDAAMELGNFKNASSLLKKGKKLGSFDYLIRLSRFKDHQGDLDSAIFYMKDAEKRTVNLENKIWINSVLGDMYGHRGLIEESYQYYLKTLSIDPNEDHALFGIAWIALSHDQNYSLAKRIVEYLIRNFPNPEYKLLLADILELLNENALAKQIRTTFLDSDVDQIYNAYLIPLLANERPEEAIKIALKEVERRPTPAAFSLLSWSYFMNDQIEIAIAICENEIYGMTHEPLDIYRMAIIYKEGKQVDRSNELLKVVSESRFELGPLVLKKIG